MYKLVLVDDDVYTINGITKHIPLREMNIELVATAMNGKDGAEAIIKHCPDIILSDIQMPLMNGFEMLEAVSNLPVEPQIIILTGFDDFNHAKLAIEKRVSAYIVKPAVPSEITLALKKAVEACSKQKNRKIKEEYIERNIAALQSHITKKFFSSYRLTAEELLDFERIYNFETDKMHYCCLTICFNPSDYGNTELFETTLQKKYILLKDDFSDSKNYIIVFDKQISESSFYNTLSETIKEFSNKSFIACGNVANIISDISLSLSQARTIIEYAFCFNFCGFLTYLTFYEDFKKFSTHPPMFDKQKVLDAVSVKNYDMLREVLKSLKNSFYTLKIYDPNYLKTLIFDFCNMILEHNNINSNDDENTNDLWMEINELQKPDDVFEYCFDLIDDLNSTLDQNDTAEEIITVNKMIQYIKNNYAQPITLVSLSHLLFYSRNHLKIIFHKHTGVDFKTYLQDYRMKKAAYLLKNTHYKLFEIAEMVGYRDLKTFRQIFLKHFGVLPSKYQSEDTADNETE